jgi:hypothetical protein
MFPLRTLTSARADAVDTFTCLEAAFATGKPSGEITPGHLMFRDKVLHEGPGGLTQRLEAPGYFFDLLPAARLTAYPVPAAAFRDVSLPRLFIRHSSKNNDRPNPLLMES